MLKSRKVIVLKRLNRCYSLFKKGLLSAKDYYKQCVLYYFKKSPPDKDVFFPLIDKEPVDLFAEPENKLGISVKVIDIGYVLQCVYENETVFSVTDNDFYKAVDKLFEVQELEEMMK